MSAAQTPKRRTGQRKKATTPPPLPAPEPRRQELIGCDEDGNMSLWDTGNVQPVTAFERNGGWIEGGHYVINWKGHAITVHCSAAAHGMIHVLFMCSGDNGIRLPVEEVEAMLLGKVIPDPAHLARMEELFRQVREAMSARNQPAHLRRGRIQ